MLGTLKSLMPEYRERKSSPTVTLAMFMAQVLRANSSCRTAVSEAMVNQLLQGSEAVSANTGGYYQARERLPIDLVRELAPRCRLRLKQYTSNGRLWHGRHVKLTGGTTTLMPNTEQTQARFPQQGGQEPGAGFPIARLLGVMALANGAMLDLAMGPYRGKGTGEYELFRELLDCFVDGDVMLADSYYCGYFLIAKMQARGVDVLFEQHGARHTDFRIGEKLGARDHRVQWSKPVARRAEMTPEEYAAYPPTLTLREVKVRKKVLVTSFLNPREVCNWEIGRLLLRRWNLELDLRNIKSTLGMEHLACKSLDMWEKEVWVYALDYNLIRSLMAAAAAKAGVPPRQLSFKHTVQVWVAWSQRQYLSTVPEDTAALFRLIAQIRVGNRHGRMGASAHQNSTQTLRTTTDHAPQSARERQEIWTSEETHGLN